MSRARGGTRVAKRGGMKAIAIVAPLALACVQSPDTADTASAVATPRVLRGVDRASAFSAHEAHLLASQHGVKWTGVYIGGECDGGSGWSRAVVERIHAATGWQFMPIFVGQQSPSICGASTLTYHRGHLDGTATASRMRAFGWFANRGIPVALDVEAGTYEHSPDGATAYVRGWVAAVHGAGYRAYVYSSPYGIVHFYDAGVHVDAAWVASYFYNGFRAVHPSDLHQIGSRYAKHDRAWQYAGDFEVAGVGRVDANTSDLVLAPAPGGTNRAPDDEDLADGALEVDADEQLAE
jgi:hypothetical protein